MTTCQVPTQLPRDGRRSQAPVDQLEPGRQRRDPGPEKIAPQITATSGICPNLPQKCAKSQHGLARASPSIGRTNATMSRTRVRAAWKGASSPNTSNVHYATPTGERVNERGEISDNGARPCGQRRAARHRRWRKAGAARRPQAAAIVPADPLRFHAGLWRKARGWAAAAQAPAAAPNTHFLLDV